MFYDTGAQRASHDKLFRRFHSFARDRGAYEFQQVVVLLTLTSDPLFVLLGEPLAVFGATPCGLDAILFGLKAFCLFCLLPRARLLGVAFLFGPLIVKLFEYFRGGFLLPSWSAEQDGEWRSITAEERIF